MRDRQAALTIADMNDEQIKSALLRGAYVAMVVVALLAGLVLIDFVQG